MHRVCLSIWLSSLLAGHGQLTWTATEVKHAPGNTVASQTYQFTAKNTSQTEVRIAAITPTCACLTATASATTIPPGGELNLTAKMDLSQLQGEQRKNLIVTTTYEDKEHRDTLVAVAQLEAFFKIDGAVAKFEVGTTGSPHRAKITIPGQTPIHLKLDEPSSKAVSATLKEIVPGREYEVTITPLDLSKKGFGSLSLTTDSPFPRAKRAELFYTIVAPRTVPR